MLEEAQYCTAHDGEEVFGERERREREVYGHPSENGVVYVRENVKRLCSLGRACTFISRREVA